MKFMVIKGPGLFFALYLSTKLCKINRLTTVPPLFISTTVPSHCHRWDRRVDQIFEQGHQVRWECFS